MYTGITTDPERRLAEHNSSVRGASYTRSRRPVTLAYVSESPDRSTASQRESQIKQLSKLAKEQLIDDHATSEMFPTEPTRS